MGEIEKDLDEAVTEAKRRSDEVHANTRSSIAELHQYIKVWKERHSQRPATHKMAGCRPIIQEMRGLDHPTENIHILLGKGMNKMGKYITHLMNQVNLVSLSDTMDSGMP